MLGISLLEKCLGFCFFCFLVSGFPGFKDLHRVQKSDAGVGIGTLVGDRDYLARK